MTTTAKIKAKGCSATGLTEDIASKLYANKGARVLAIVELKSDKTHESADGDRQVDLSIETIEPVVDGGLNGTLDEHVRNIAAALYRNRQLAEGAQDELPLDGDDGPAPKVADIIAQGDALLERDDDGQVTGTWDGDTDEEPESEADPYEYVHSSVGAAPGADTACGLRATIGKSLHLHKDRGEVGCPECLSALDAEATSQPTTTPFSVVPS